MSACPADVPDPSQALEDLVRCVKCVYIAVSGAGRVSATLDRVQKGNALLTP